MHLMVSLTTSPTSNIVPAFGLVVKPANTSHVPTWPGKGEGEREGRTEGEREGGREGER